MDKDQQAKINRERREANKRGRQASLNNANQVNKERDAIKSNDSQNATANDGDCRSVLQKNFFPVVEMAAGLGLFPICGSISSLAGYEKANLFFLIAALSAVELSIFHYFAKKNHKFWTLWFMVPIIAFQVWVGYVLKIKPGDLIPGTQTTHNELEQKFPFGYLVITLNKGNWCREIPPGDNAKWDIDWNTFKVIPDFTKREVKWFVRFNMVEPKSSFYVGNHTNIQTTPMVVNEVHKIKSITMAGSEVHAFVSTLSDNQRLPVFAIGFRIPENTKGNPQ